MVFRTVEPDPGDTNPRPHARSVSAPTAADRVLDGPAVLVFQRPRTLFVRLNGFADRDTVAQAAANADTLAR